MSNPNNVTVSLEMAKKLRDAGWEQDYPFLFYLEKDEQLYRNGEIVGQRNPDEPHEVDMGPFIAAPTAEEILRELPEEKRGATLNTIGHTKVAYLWKDLGKITYSPAPVARDLDGNVDYMQFEADTLANAAAKMWIYLKENNLLNNV